MMTSRPGHRSWSTAPTDAHAHHADLWTELTRREAALVTAVADGADFQAPRTDLVEFLRGDVAEHLRSEERVLYSTARVIGETALARALELDHNSLLSLVEHIDQATTGLDAALSARALVVLFALRMEKEESVLLPALRAGGVDVESVLKGKTSLTGDRRRRH